MITAEEARLQGRENIKLRLEKEIGVVEEAINYAIKKGDSEVTYISLSERMISKLRELGYVVKDLPCDPRDGRSYYTISF